MKLLFTALLCLLLCACSASPEVPPSGTVPSLSQADHSLPDQAYSPVEAVSLPISPVEQIFPLEEGLLLVSGRELVVLDGQHRKAAERTLPFDGEISLRGNIISAFDPQTRQQLLLDSSLQELRQVTLPGALTGKPVLSTDGNSLFYCTGSGIYRWDLDSGIRRRIRESDWQAQQLVETHRQDALLQCRILDGSRQRDLFLDAQSGQLLQELDVTAQLFTEADRYYCSFPGGFVDNYLFGTDPDAPQALLRFPKNCTFLPKCHGCVTQELSEGATVLTCFCLKTGRVRDALTLEHPPKALVDAGDGCVWILLSGDSLLKWHPKETAAAGETYIGPYETPASPDTAGLAQCREYAQALSLKYGLEIRLGQDAVTAMPWDYVFTPEHRSYVMLAQLQTLERCLARYPRELLEQTAANFDRLTFCLVQSITGSADGQSLSIATGIQFQEGAQAYVVLSAGAYLEQALYHELYHVMETHILSRSGALDRWSELNPAGFSYDLDFAANAGRNSGVYLENGTRAFVDTYSMSFPKEDRARLFEYAMLPDQSHLFQSQIMQRKLTALCTAIREAYGLEAVSDILPWEQYLR